MERRTLFKMMGAGLLMTGCPSSHLRHHNPFTDELTYTEAEYAQLTIGGFGDSNLNGRFLPDRKSLPELAADLAKERGVGIWTPHNLSYVGATSEQTLNNQVRRPDIRAFIDTHVPKFDCWINAGGNDVNKMFDSPDEFAELHKIMNNPVRSLVSPFFVKLYQTLLQTGPDYLALLEGTVKEYDAHIRRFVLILPPNFGIAEELHIGQTAEDTKKIKLDTRFKKFVVAQSSGVINNMVRDAIGTFKLRHPDKQVIAINTFGFRRDCFLNDQHFNRNGQTKIVEEVMRRSVVAG